MKNYQKGFALPMLLLIIAALLIGGGAYVYEKNKQANQPVTAISTAPLIVDPKIAKVGDVVGSWAVDSINNLSFYPDGSPASGRIDFTGGIVITGILGANEMTGQIIFTPNKEGETRIPSFRVFDFSKSFGLTGDTQKLSSAIGQNITIEIRNFEVSFEGKGGSGPHAEFVRVTQ